MASKLRRYGKYALLMGGAGLSSYAVFRLIDQKKEVHFRKKQKQKPNVNEKIKLELMVSIVLSHFIYYRNIQWRPHHNSPQHNSNQFQAKVCLQERINSRVYAMAESTMCWSSVAALPVVESLSTLSPEVNI